MTTESQVAKLPEKWREDVRTKYGQGPSGSALLHCAAALESALAQDRASQAGALPPPGQPFVGCQCPTCGEEFAASAAQPPAVGVDVSDEMVSAGTVLSNIVYNLAHDDRLPEALRTSLDAARKRWDAALRTGGGADHG